MSPQSTPALCRHCLYPKSEHQPGAWRCFPGSDEYFEPQDTPARVGHDAETPAELQVPDNVVDAAYAHVETMVSRADQPEPFPLWHGWALRESYCAGYLAAHAQLERENAALKAAVGWAACEISGHSSKCTCGVCCAVADVAHLISAPHAFRLAIDIRDRVIAARAALDLAKGGKAEPEKR